MSIQTEINRITGEVTSQTNLINQIKTALDGKAGGSGGEVNFADGNIILAENTYTLTIPHGLGKNPNFISVIPYGSGTTVIGLGLVLTCFYDTNEGVWRGINAVGVNLTPFSYIPVNVNFLDENTLSIQAFTNSGDARNWHHAVDFYYFVGVAKLEQTGG